MKLVHDKPPFLKVLIFSTLFGVLIGVFTLWLFSPGEPLLASVGTGIAFTVTFAIASRFTTLSGKPQFFGVAILAGLVAGAVWWAIAKPHVPVILSMLTGAGFAAAAVWGESGLLFGRKG